MQIINIPTDCMQNITYKPTITNIATEENFEMICDILFKQTVFRKQVLPKYKMIQM